MRVKTTKNGWHKPDISKFLSFFSLTTISPIFLSFISFRFIHVQEKKKDRKKDKKKERKDEDKKKVPDYYYPHNSYYPNNGGGDPYYKPRSGTYVNCPYGSALQVMRIGYPVCLEINEILCKDGWKFGIIQTGYGNNTESHLELRRDNSDNERMVDLVYRKFPTANSLCIAEHHQNVAVLSVGVEDGTWYLACPNAGNPNKLPRLKIVEDADSGDRHQLVVRFRDGAGEDDTLWELFANGKTETASDCAWFFIANAVPSPVPSSSPTVSASPSSSPSVSPSDLPSARYVVLLLYIHVFAARSNNYDYDSFKCLHCSHLFLSFVRQCYFSFALQSLVYSQCHAFASPQRPAVPSAFCYTEY